MSANKMLEIIEASRKLPRPISCFGDGAACPWCGVMHQTVTFGDNTCRDCQRPFSFGYPDWHSGADPVSWVPFPHREFEAVGSLARFIEDWEPNDRLKHHYHQKAEERTGIYADKGNPQ